MTPATDDGADTAAAPDPAPMRRSYEQNRIDEALHPDVTWPQLLGQWFAAAAASGQVGEANAMQLATVDATGRPGVRTVLAKSIDERGVAFYTNLRSAKGAALDAHPYAEAVFAWLPLERQVRLRGPVEPVPEAETLAYWRSRPRGSQIGAWASPQSARVADRAELEAAYAHCAARFDGADVPLPPYWGGLRIVPEAVEFWQGRPDRLHDRLLFERDGDHWATHRLAP
ncbi:MAG: pdxH [Jatrophihabitantaceae bacterium]|nr:pdxH [Jatrophihabitantaceae bacterium]